MEIRKTPLGEVRIGTREELFSAAIALAADQKETGGLRSWAFTGGSTPKAWYEWCVDEAMLPGTLLEGVVFTVSDERHVPLADDDSNFGHADRGLLSPLDLPAEQKCPWPVELPAAEAASAYAAAWAEKFGAEVSYDLCFLGMGDDAHTASLFPGSPLLTEDGGKLFAAIEVPGKGWRLTITPAGLARCGTIVVMALGAGKGPALSRVFGPSGDVLNAPSQLLHQFADRVVWLIDAPAAAGLPA